MAIDLLYLVVENDNPSFTIQAVNFNQTECVGHVKDYACDIVADFPNLGHNDIIAGRMEAVFGKKLGTFVQTGPLYKRTSSSHYVDSTVYRLRQVGADILALDVNPIFRPQIPVEIIYSFVDGDEADRAQNALTNGHDILGMGKLWGPEGTKQKLDAYILWIPVLESSS